MSTTRTDSAGFRVAIPAENEQKGGRLSGCHSPPLLTVGDARLAGFRVAIPRPLRQASALPSPTRHTRAAGTERTDDLQRPTLPINERDFHSRYPGVFPGATSRSGTCPPRSLEIFSESDSDHLTKANGHGPFQHADGNRRSEMRAQPSHRNRLARHKVPFFHKTATL